MDINDFISSKFSAVVGGSDKTYIDKQNLSTADVISILLNPAIRSISAALRAEVDADKRDLLKNKLPYITPYGSFSYRNNKSILSYNSSILAIDIDDIPEDIDQVFNIFKNSKYCILAFTSPKGKGVKALIHLQYNFNTEEHYNLLSSNERALAAALGIYKWRLDPAQFKLSQPFFLFNSGDLYFNLAADPLILVLNEKPVIEKKAKRESDLALSFEFKAKIIDPKLQPAVNARLNQIYEDEFLRYLNKDKARHQQIYMIRSVAAVIHYADKATADKLYNAGLKAIEDLYGSPEAAEQKNVYKSYHQIWIDTPKINNESIDSLL